MTAEDTTAGLYRSTRPGIMVAFVVPVVLIGISCAMVTGLPIDWENAYLGGTLILSLIMISNGLNNIVDESVDIASVQAGSKKSEMYHVLCTTKGLSYGALISIIVVFGFASFVSLGLLVIHAGYLVIAFAAFGLFLALEYNLPPLKLAYRPFPELTMLLPASAVAVLGVQYILVGS